MLRRIALAAALAPAFVTLPQTAFGQTAQPGAAVPPGAGAPAIRPTRPQPSPVRPGHGSHHHRGGGNRSTPNVLIDAGQYVATPNPHKTPFHNATHNTIPAGEDVFSSRSTNDR